MASRKTKQNYAKLAKVMLAAFLLAFAFIIAFELLYRPAFQVKSDFSRAQIFVPAVDNNGKGVLAKLTVELKPGDGKVLTDIENLLFWADTQLSIQTAKQAAEKFTHADLSRSDLIYTVEADHTRLIGGGSAGAALAIATVAVIQNRTLDPAISITGAIDEEGNVLPVGGVAEKAEAVYAQNITILLVPPGQSGLSTLLPRKSCISRGRVEVCEVKYEKGSLSDLGPEVAEVRNIYEAALIFGLRR